MSKPKVPDVRYTITREWTGRATQCYVVRFCGTWIDRADNLEDAEFFASDHNASRMSRFVETV